MSWEDRFWSKVDKRGPDNCWPWTAALDTKGYGVFWGGYDRGLQRAHRAAYELANGHLPPLLRHTCDNRECVNPAHLVPGSQQQNMDDMVERGRSNRGEKNGISKLKASDIPLIREMLSLGVAQWRIAKEFGVRQMAISDINTGTTWWHVKEED